MTRRHREKVLCYSRPGPECTAPNRSSCSVTHWEAETWQPRPKLRQLHTELRYVPETVWGNRVLIDSDQNLWVWPDSVRLLTQVDCSVTETALDQAELAALRIVLDHLSAAVVVWFPSMSVCVFVNLMLHHHRVLGCWWLSWWSRCFMCRGCVLAAGPVWSFSCQMKVQRQKTKQATTKTSTYPLVNVQTQNSHRVYTFIRHDAARTDGREHLERMKHREKLHFKKLSCLCGQARGSSGAARLSRTVSVGICGETNHLAGFTLWILNELWSVCCGAAGFWRRLFQCYSFFLLYCSVRFAASVFFQYCSNPRWVNRTSTHTVRTYCCSSLFCKEVILFG